MTAPYPDTLPFPGPIDGAGLRALGIEGWPFGMAGRVAFADLDPLAHVNNAVYFRWFEALRVTYLRAWGLSRYSDPGTEPRIVIRSTECRYITEMRHDESFVVTGRTTAFRRTSFTMDYAIHAPDLRATGSAVVVLLSPDGSGRLEIPDPVRQRFVEIDDAAAEG